MQIYPSLIAADQSNLEGALRQLEPHVPGFHLDIIDNKFAPSAGMSIETVNTVAKLAIKPLWVHLLVEDPAAYLEKLKLPAGAIITFHIEAHKEASRLIQKIQEKEWRPSLAIKPKTGVNEIFPFLPSIYQLLIMSVEPGFSGQPFLPGTLAKTDPLVGLRNTEPRVFKIAMEGGISIKNIVEIAAKGVDQVAVGTEIFGHKAGPVEAYKILAGKVP